MNTFVVTLEIMKPDGAARGQSKGRRFVRYAQAVAWNDEAKRDAVVVGAHFEQEIRFRLIVPHQNSRAAGVIERIRMHSSRRMSFVEAIPFDLCNRAAATKIDAIDEHDQR